LPANSLGDAAVAELRRFGVNTRYVRRAGDRIGIYFVEKGAGQRPSTVLYDRARSAIAAASPNDFDWSLIFDDADWFHISGITPAISEAAADLAMAAVKAARARGVTISCDYNYRANLWQYGVPAPDVMRTLVAQVDIGIANEEDCQRALGIKTDMKAGHALDRTAYRRLAEHVLAEFPNLRKQVITLRESHSADHNGWSACLHNRSAFLVARRYDIADIVDRVGSGDAFAAGLIYAWLTDRDDADALEFGTAAGCLKHAISGDFNMIQVSDIRRLVEGDASGRVQR
jgi:2-dehydro-3-deoxygluconokinase